MLQRPFPTSSFHQKKSGFHSIAYHFYSHYISGVVLSRDNKNIHLFICREKVLKDSWLLIRWELDTFKHWRVVVLIGMLWFSAWIHDRPKLLHVTGRDCFDQNKGQHWRPGSLTVFNVIFYSDPLMKMYAIFCKAKHRDFLTLFLQALLVVGGIAEQKASWVIQNALFTLSGSIPESNMADTCFC